MVTVTFVNHSCFVVETEQSVLIFDYYKGELPPFDTEKEVYFLASHVHDDHFKPIIFAFANRWKHVRYILSEDIRYRLPSVSDEVESCISYMGSGQEKTVGNLHIKTLKSTDEGVAFVDRWKCTKR